MANHKREFSRVVVVGSSGAGKSTLAGRLGKATGLPVLHQDQLFWEPNCQEPEDRVFRSRVAAAIAQESWILDGNLGRVADLVLPRTELVVWIEASRTVCAARVLWRSLRHAGRTRIDMAPECREHFSVELLEFIWNFDGNTRAKIEGRLAQFGPQVPVVHLHDRRAVDAFVAETVRRNH
jgi:adenylate kinase family enzyme